MGTFSAVTMGIAVLLAIIFAGIQSHPAGYIPGDEPLVTIVAGKGTTYVLGTRFPVRLGVLMDSAGMSAFLNITYTFVGQATLPSVCLS